MKYWLFLFGLSLSFLLRAEMIWQSDLQKPFAITIKLSSQQITLNDLLELEADFHYPSSYQLDVQALLDQLTWSANPLAPRLSLIQSSIENSPVKEGMQAQRLQATLSPLTIGSLDVSFLNVSFVSKEEGEPSIRFLTPVFSLQVLPSPPTPSLPTASLMPLEPQFPLGLTEANHLLFIHNPERLEEEKRRIREALERHAFPWLAAITLIGFGGIGWAAYLMRDRWFKRPLKPMTILSPKQKINQIFDHMQKQHLLEQGLFQTYYAGLSSILLIALQARLNWKKREMTTVEIAKALKDESILSLTQKQNLLSWLTGIDQVKFAGKKASLEEAKQITQQIRRFIEE